MATPGNLRKNLKDKVFRGRNNPLSTLSVTSTGTGLGSVNYVLGQMVLDSSAGDWFLCTATAAAGTWVQINA